MSKSEALIKHITILLEQKKYQLQLMKDDIKQWENRLKMNERSIKK